MTASFVLDCSVAASWCFQDESSAYSQEALGALAAGKAYVPCIWLLEVINVLLVAERKKRINTADSRYFLTLLQSLPIETVLDASWGNAPEWLLLGRHHRLSAYDSAYLKLALDLGLPLATLDGPLKKAAQDCQVPLWP